MNAPARIAADSARAALLKRMLAGEAGTARAAPAPIGRRDPARAVPLTLEQSQLWLHAQMAPDMPLYNESITIHRHGPYDHEVMARALTEFVRRHPAWRTAFVETEAGVEQQIAPSEPISLPLIDLTLHPDKEAAALRLATQAARTPIPLDHAPLFRAYVARLAPEEHRLYLTLHHIIFDGVSIYRTLMPELAAIVAAFERGEASPLPEPALDYADYAVWQAAQTDGPDAARQIAHWREALAGPLPRLELAGDHPRPAQPTHAGSMEVFELSEALIDRLKALARAEGATLYMVLLAAYKAMLYRYTGDTDIIVGGVTDTRRRPELQPLVGYFLNTMALRSRPQGAVSFRDYLAQVKASVIGALGACDVPFDRLVRELGIRRGQGTHPLFNTLFSIEPPVDPFAPGWDLTQMDVVVGAAKYDLYLELDERPEGMAGRFLYSTELFEVPTIRRMIGHWIRLLEGVADNPATMLADLPMLDADETAQLAGGWDGPWAPAPFGTVVAGVAAQVAARPDAVAITQGETAWRYSELDAHADAIAAALADRVAPGALVALALDRTPWMVAAMLGVLRAGAAYLPLDARQPPARLKALVERAGAALVLTDAASAAVAPDSVQRLLVEEIAPQPFAGPPPGAEMLAYCRYTSGSTGEPKGVEIGHAALANLLAAMQRRPGFAAGARLLAVTTLSFDIAELELWLPLVSGGTVLLATREEAGDMAALAARIARDTPDMMQATPATWRGLIEAGWTGSQRLTALCGGEALTPALAGALRPRVGKLWNMYGPTETTIWSTVAEVDAGEISIGSAIDNTQLRVVDADGNLVPQGAVGELWIGGAGVARGYRGRPDLTGARFVEGAGARFYRTGDRARWRGDGTLECLGRRDNEVKVRGFRIALEEVEAALASLPGVRAAAARTWAEGEGGHSLAGYVVGEGDAATWRAALAELLPDYMIPTRFVAMDALPIGATGKVDRAALPEPVVAGGKGTPPETPLEQQLAAIWQDVLGVADVARDDDFFDLGGHSLLVARLLRRLKTEMDVQLPMGALFRARRLADMAALIASGRPLENPALVPIQPHGRQTPILWLEAASLFVPLAERLGPDQPFMGIALGQIFERGCPTDFNDAAALVVETIRQVQPKGPYRLGGLCTAGILAHAVAAQMRAAGDDVELLVLAHAAHPPHLRGMGRLAKLVSKLRYHLPLVLKAPAGQRWRYFQERVRGLWETAAPFDPEAVLAPRVQAVLEAGAWRYDPPAYDGDVLVIEPREGPRIFRYAEAWRGDVSGRFDAHLAPGDHWGMIAPPHVDAFAVHLRAALGRGATGLSRAA
ncbi:amino acid adenylation domain-containing protein [Sphingomonas sp.]|uniref:non-ribosomal peptide synthetase n=1 Tax=Sphingomonas sp. TaxID=28214 RepID=UPI001E0A8BF4|nr:amino acid adenylation domain-containing protein [Sphingomonas sp.]MBX9797497.1 amino acid adenylation domain-containing protein [Sphingomonas sp.]